MRQHATVKCEVLTHQLVRYVRSLYVNSLCDIDPSGGLGTCVPMFEVDHKFGNIYYSTEIHIISVIAGYYSMNNRLKVSYSLYCWLPLQ